MTFRPNITVAAVIRWQDSFLLVEERDHGRQVFASRAVEARAHGGEQAARPGRGEGQASARWRRRA